MNTTLESAAAGGPRIAKALRLFGAVGRRTVFGRAGASQDLFVGEQPGESGDLEGKTVVDRRGNC